MKTVQFRRRLLAVLVIAYVAGIGCASAQEPAAKKSEDTAQKDAPQQAAPEDAKPADAKPKDIDKVEVVGIRRNIQESLAIKQEAVGVVDVVLSEDIGKFPDDNLAEALQRVPGVTMTRDGSEGRNILVRGLGAGYNITTLNGRRMASADSDRDFSYDTMSSELVRSLSVYKSAEARLPDGGIGAVIDIQTRRPLSLDPGTWVAAGDYSYDTRSNDKLPSGTFLYSDHNDDSTFGVTLSAAYSKRNLRRDIYSGAGFYNADPQYESTDVVLPWDVNGDGVVDFNDTTGVSEGTASTVPLYMYFTNDQDERIRTGASAALQWRPSDNFDINFDVLYSKLTTDGKQSQIGFVNYDESWTPGTPQIRNVHLNGQGHADRFTVTGRPMVELLSISNPRKVDTWQAGLNAVWYVDPALQLTADVSRSEAKDRNDGNNDFIVVRAFVDSFNIDDTPGRMVPDVILNPGLGANQDYGAHYTTRSGVDIVSKVDGLKLEGLWNPSDAGAMTSLNFGLHYDGQSKQRREVSTPNGSMFSRGGYYLGRGGYSYNPSLAFTVGDFTLFRVPSSIFRNAGFSNFLAGEGSRVPSSWPSFDSNALLDFYRGINPAAYAAGTQPRLLPAQSYAVGEDMSTLFAQAKFEGELRGMDYLLDVGLRYTHTTVQSSGYSYDFSRLVLDNQGRPTNNNWRNVVPWVYSDNYENLLPSLNFRLRINDQMQLRASAAEVIARPPLDALRPWASPNFEDRGRNGNPQLDAGNPGVEPERATQYDATWEWYYGEGSALNFGLYYKKIKSFIVAREETENFFGYTFDVTKPRMDQYGADLKGFEVAWQQSMKDWLPQPFDGLGVSLNYTYVESKYKDPSYRGAGFTGMSKNAYNAAVYYEKGPLQARVAYNWRDKYFNYENWGGNAYISDYGQLDASLSYDISDRFSLTLDAVNLTNERYSGYTRVPGQVDYVERFGTQVGFGLRAKF